MIKGVKDNYYFIPKIHPLHNSLKKEELPFFKKKNNSEETKSFKSYLETELINSSNEQ